MLGLRSWSLTGLRQHKTSQIPGLTLRPATTADDPMLLAAVTDACRQADHIDLTSQAEGIPSLSDLAHLLSDAERASNVLIVELDGALIGYNVLSTWVEPDGTYAYHHRGYLMPAFRGRGIGSEMLGWMEDRIRDMAANLPRPVRAAITANASSTERGTGMLLFKAGYVLSQAVTEMRRSLTQPLPTAYLPYGLEVRRVRPRHYRAIWEALNGRQNAGQRAQESYHAFLTDPHFDSDLWRVAWAGEQIAGIVTAERAGQAGVIARMWRAREWFSTGTMRGMLVHALHNLRAQGCEEAHLYTQGDAMHAETSLFASVGFRVHKLYGRYRKPLTLR